MPHCQNCGEHVTTQSQCVFGDNDGDVYGCHTCLTRAEIADGHATCKYRDESRQIALPVLVDSNSKH